MECPDCQWESLPGTKVCPVCGHSFEKRPHGPTIPPRSYSGARLHGFLGKLLARLSRSRSSRRLIPKTYELSDPRQLRTLGITCLGIIPGLGHFVQGIWRWGTILAGGFIVAAVLTPLTWHYWVSNLTGLLALFLPLFSMAHAGGLASRKSATRKDSGVLVLFPLLLVLLLSWRAYDNNFSIVSVEGNSLAPAVSRGEQVVVSKSPERLMALKRGDLVHFLGYGYGEYALRADRLDGLGFDPDRADAALEGRLLGRVVGLPGEHLLFKKGLLYANGVQVPRSLYPMWNPAEGAQVTLKPSEYLVVSANLGSVADVPELGGRSGYRSIRGKVVSVILPTSARRSLE
ncbi:MAG: hypothetical protein JW759_07315 [Candidatus Coatesbacteria bacterium]|nr:hypothetical protein [Candidatus Coatesbacteria bacterium]